MKHSNNVRFYVLKCAQGPYKPESVRCQYGHTNGWLGVREYVCHYMCKNEPQQLQI